MSRRGGETEMVTEEAKEGEEEVMMANEEDTGETKGEGVETIIIPNTTIEEAKVTIMTEVVTGIDKEGMIIVIKEDIMPAAVEVTITTMIGAIEGVEETTTEGTGSTTMEADMAVAVDMVAVAMEVEEAHVINQEAMQILVCEEIGETPIDTEGRRWRILKSLQPVRDY